jgi:UDP-N-acetylmuramyl pentapeptide synthase
MAFFNSASLADTVARRLDKEAMVLVAQSRLMGFQGVVHAAVGERYELLFKLEQS